MKIRSLPHSRFYHIDSEIYWKNWLETNKKIREKGSEIHKLDLKLVTSIHTSNTETRKHLNELDRDTENKMSELRTEINKVDMKILKLQLSSDSNENQWRPIPLILLVLGITIWAGVTFNMKSQLSDLNHEVKNLKGRLIRVNNN